MGHQGKNNEKFPGENTYFHGCPLIVIHDGDEII